MRLWHGVGAAALAAIVMVAFAASAGGQAVHGHPAAAVSDPLVAAAGDIACDPSSSKFHNGQGTSSACKARSTGDLILSEPIDAVLALGDNQYQCGGYSAYLQSFDPAWGRFKAMIHPVPGDNEYETSGTDCASGAAGYFRYFGAAAGDSRGDSAFTLGAWRLVGLNAECGHAGGCGSSSPQAAFLRNQLGIAQCTLVYWHQPFYTGTSRTASSYKAFWDLLYAGNAEIVLNGHLHNYSRFAPQDASGHVDQIRGVRQFIVGTGGRSLFSLDGTRNVEKTTKQYGVLELRLHATSYNWSFVNTAGTVVDSGSAACH
jgi:calcineurin-like phosphoesterase family protein